MRSPHRRTMKLILVTVSAIAVLSANSRGFIGEPKELGRSDKPPRWSDSPKLHQTLKKIIPDEPASRDSTNKAQKTMGNALLVPNSARSRQLPELPQLMRKRPLNINSTTDKDLKERKRKSKMASRSCGGVYTSSNGRIDYPTRGNYQNNENCVWIIRTTRQIRITFLSFSTETRYDFLYVRDGDSPGSRELGKFHGNAVPRPLQTSGNAAYLQFTSDYSNIDRGFVMTWESIACGGEYRHSYGTIQHPSAGNYQNNENCAWIIRAYQPIKITIHRFNTEGRYDFLYIRDGASSRSMLLGKFHGSVVPSPAQTSGNNAHLHFTSDGSVTSKGFLITWEPHDPGYSPVVRKYAPKLRFDSKFGKDDYCFPSSAAEYYNARRAHNHGRICNRYYSSVQNGRVPTYWKATKSAANLYIAFWFFYGYQESCGLFDWYGGHDADWEHIYVKVEKLGTIAEKLGSIQFYQKNGWYTRNRGSYEVDGTHPIVYVGKNHHGSYHDDGGWPGGCGYYEDYRNPGSANMMMNTWLNLEELGRGIEKPTFMRDHSNNYFDGIPQPLNRAETDNMVNLKGCKEGGCSKSHYDENSYI